jgi:hypothetical protein
MFVGLYLLAHLLILFELKLGTVGLRESEVPYCSARIEILSRKNLQLDHLTLLRNTGTHGAGSSLRQMLSVRDISDDMEEVIKCAVELEAAECQRKGVSSSA